LRDEARVGQKGGHAYIWAPVGAAMITPCANTWAMNLHLKEISAQLAPSAHAILVCDGAGWHQRGKKLRVPDNITLLSLPPYSPELNPMENA
jgi:transposase